MKQIERVVWGVLLIVCIVLYFTKSPEFSTKTVVIPGDSIPYEIKIPYDSLIFVDTGTYSVDTLWLHDTAFMPIDTAAILVDYFKVISYDSIPVQNDSSMTIYANARITQNRLYNFNVFAQNNRKTTIINNYQQESFIGIGAVLGRNMFAPTVSFQRKHHEVGVGYEIYNGAFLVKYQYKFPFNLKRYGK